MLASGHAYSPESGVRYPVLEVAYDSADTRKEAEPCQAADVILAMFKRLTTLDTGSC